MKKTKGRYLMKIDKIVLRTKSSRALMRMCEEMVQP